VPPPISELRVLPGPPFGWLRVSALYRWRCSECGADAEEDILVLAEWLDRRGSTAQRSVADGVTCPECAALDPLDVPLLQLRGADGVGLLVGLPARTASADDEAAIRGVLTVAGSVRPLIHADVVAAIRMAWWGSLWNRPLGPSLVGVLPLVLPESDEEAERWRRATVEALKLPDLARALAKFVAAESDTRALGILADHAELTDPRWRLTVDVLVEQLREAQQSEEAVAALNARVALLSRARLLGTERALGELLPALATLVDTATTATDLDNRIEALDALRDTAARDDLDPALQVAVGLAWLEARHGARDRRVAGDRELLADARATSQLATTALGSEHEMTMQADLNLAAYLEDVAESGEELIEAENLLLELGQRAARVGSAIVTDAATNLSTVVARHPGTRADNPLDAAECLADARFMRPLLRSDPARDEIVALIDEAATLRSRVSGSLRDNAKRAVALIRTAVEHERWNELSPADQALSLSNLANALHQLHERAPDEATPEEVRGAAQDAFLAARKLDRHNPVAMRVLASSGASLIHLYAESAVDGAPDLELWREGTDVLEAAFEATREAYPAHHRNVLVAALNLASAHGSPIEERVANPERCAELLQYVIERAPPSEAEARMKAAMNLGQLRSGQGAWAEAADALEVAADAHDQLFAGARLFSTRLGEIVDAGDLAARRALALIGAERYREAVRVLEASRARLRPAREPESDPSGEFTQAAPERALVHIATCAYGTLGVVALPDGRFAPFTTALNSRRLRPLVDGLLRAEGLGQRRDAFDRLAETIGPAVVTPVIAALDAASGPLDEVVIVACGTLATCPVARIPDERGRALIDLHPIREAVSVRALPDTSPPSPTAVLAVIDPDGDLPYARAEREALGSWAERIEEPHADRPVAAWLMAALPRVRAAHLACHGRFDPDNPMCSTFRLGGQATLTVADLAELELPDLDLVVAPACQSASGGPDAPDELLGVAHMLAHAGARHVIASLWDADDATTALTVARLYKELAAGQPPHAALQRAQLWVSTVSGQELATWSRDRLRGSDDAAWLPYDLAIEFSARSAHPSYRSADRPVFGHPALWATLSCLDS
jgi:CHAT domain-containing protein